MFLQLFITKSPAPKIRTLHIYCNLGLNILRIAFSEIKGH